MQAAGIMTDFFRLIHVAHFLVHFPIDNSTAIVKRASILCNEKELVKGMECQVKEKSKVFTAKVIDIGKCCAMCAWRLVMITDGSDASHTHGMIKFIVWSLASLAYLFYLYTGDKKTLSKVEANFLEEDACTSHSDESTDQFVAEPLPSSTRELGWVT